MQEAENKILHEKIKKAELEAAKKVDVAEV